MFFQGLQEIVEADDRKLQEEDDETLIVIIIVTVVLVSCFWAAVTVIICFLVERRRHETASINALENRLENRLSRMITQAPNQETQSVPQTINIVFQESSRQKSKPRFSLKRFTPGNKRKQRRPKYTSANFGSDGEFDEKDLFKPEVKPRKKRRRFTALHRISNKRKLVKTKKNKVEEKENVEVNDDDEVQSFNDVEKQSSLNDMFGSDNGKIQEEADIFGKPKE